MRTLRLRTVVLMVAALSTLGVHSTAIADLYSINAHGDLDWPAQGIFKVDDEPVSGPVLLQDGLGTATGSITAQKGAVKGSLSGFFNARAFETHRFNPAIDALSQGTIQIDGPTPTVETSVNLHIDGSLNVTAQPHDRHPFTVADGLVTFELEVHGIPSLLAASVSDTNNGQNAGVVFNAFTGLAIVPHDSFIFINGTGKTPLITLPTGVPLLSRFEMTLGFVHLTSAFPGVSTFSGDFDNTFSWATDRPVFDLPPGYTVNGMGIVDNHYTVPEPANGFAALCLALVSVFYPRNRSRSRPRPLPEEAGETPTATC